MSDLSGIDPGAKRSFGALIDLHISRGTRPPNCKYKGDRSKSELARAMGKSLTTISNWIDEINLPSSVTPLELQFFGDKPELDNEDFTKWRREFRDAFTQAQARKKGREAGKKISEAPKNDITSPVKANWRPNNLPFISLGPLFKGRDEFIEKLHSALMQGGNTAIVGRALHGLGGVGKTRLAVEYALRYASQYTATFFISCETPQVLSAGLAALSGQDMLDLCPSSVTQEEMKVIAVRRWLRQNAGWLMILDNVDSVEAGKAVMDSLPYLNGGHFIITGRLRNFPASIRTIELGVLSAEDGAAYILERTDRYRISSANDVACAHQLASELDGLALGLEQAASYIANRVISLEMYIQLWKSKRDSLLRCFSKDQMTYNRDVGLDATWATTVDSISFGGRMLLERLSFLAPEAIPDLLLDVDIPGDEVDYSPREARADLYAYSMASPAILTGGMQGFVVHRLVQDYVRRAMPKVRRDSALHETGLWIIAASTPIVEGNRGRPSQAFPSPWFPETYQLSARSKISVREEGLSLAQWCSVDFAGVIAEPLKVHAAVVAQEEIAQAEQNSPGTSNCLLTVLKFVCYLTPVRAIELLSNARQCWKESTIDGIMTGDALHVLSILVVRNTSNRREAQQLILDAAEAYVAHSQIAKLERVLEDMRAYDIGPGFAVREERCAALKKYLSDHGMLTAGNYLHFKLAAYQWHTRSALASLDLAVAEAAKRDQVGEFAHEIYSFLFRYSGWDFDEVWRKICTYIETFSEMRTILAWRVIDAFRDFPSKFGVVYAEGAVKLLRDALDRSSFKNALHAKRKRAVDLILLRIDLLKQTKNGLEPDWQNALKRMLSIYYQSENLWTEDGRCESSNNHDGYEEWFWIDGINFISDIIELDVLSAECDALLDNRTHSRWRSGWLKRKALPILSKRLFAAGKTHKAAAVAMDALASNWTVAISKDHSGILELEALLSHHGFSFEKIREENMPTKFLNKTINRRDNRHVSMSIIINARNRICFLAEGKLTMDPVWISLNNAYITIHFEDGGYQIIDCDMAYLEEKLVAAESKLFFIRTVRGEPVEGYDTRCLMNTWPEGADTR